MPETSDRIGPAEAGPLAVELESVQSAARWLVGASAAVLAVLLAGVQLSALGRLGTDSPGRLAVAAGAAVAGLVAIGAVLILAARVLVHPGWTLGALAHLELPDRRWDTHWLKSQLNAQRGLLVPDEDLRPARLYRRHRRLLVAWFELNESGSTSLPDDLDTETPTNPKRTYTITSRDDVQRLEQRLACATLVTERVSAAANLAEVRRRYRHLVKLLPFVGAIVLISVPAFAWATTVGQAPLVTAPTPVEIRVGNDRSALAEAGIAPSCAGHTVDGVAVAGSLLQPVVVSSSCSLDQVRITRDVGTVIPQLAAGQ